MLIFPPTYFGNAMSCCWFSDLSSNVQDNNRIQADGNKLPPLIQVR